MEASAACLNLIRVSEGLALNPYKDAAEYWTVGYGHKLKSTEVIGPVTYQDAEALLEADVQAVELEVEMLIIGLTLTQGQFDALVDFSYNLGSAALATSTLLKLLRAGDIMGASSEFPKWCHADVNGNFEVLAGLMKRRLAERSMFLSGLPLTG